MPKKTGSTANNNIEVILEPQNLVRIPLDIISETKERFDCCMDSIGLSFLVQNESLLKAITELKNRSISSRFITQITTENKRYCNLLMKYSEVFHNDLVKGNFLIVDGTKYLFYIMDDDHGETHAITQLFHTGVKSFVDTQQYLFDNLCTKSIPAKEKIREIGRGIKGNFTDVIQSPSEIQKITKELMESSTSEILLLFSTTNSFFRAEYSGMLNALWEASQRGVTVKMLIEAAADNNDNELTETIERTIKQKNMPVNVQYIVKPLETKITTLVIDQAVSLAIEVNDDTKKTFEESTGVAIYSNNELNVSSSLTIFETLWIQSEFDKQNKIKQAYFQMFKGFELKDEFYTRRWSFEQQTKKKNNN